LSAVVFGGYGAFGSLVSRELARRGVPVTVAGRVRAPAEALARELGPEHRGVAADARDPDDCRAAIRGHAVAVCCAGPFSSLGGALLEACLEVGCHYADIADDRTYATRVRALDERFRRRGLAAVYGASSLPGLSGALALRVRAGATSAPDRARVTLFIGNDNPKGRAAIRSAVEGLGRPIAAPQGTLRGFVERDVVYLPGPFGRRAVYTFESPDYDLLPDLVGVKSVAVKVGFESRAATAGFALLARVGRGGGAGVARALEWIGGLVPGGTSGGAIQVELFWPDGVTRRAALHATRDGQRMAALPCALVGRALAEGTASSRGALTAYELLGAEPLLEGVTAAGFRLRIE
jgi:hypothetical protein